VYNGEAWNSTWITLADRSGHALGLDRDCIGTGEGMENVCVCGRGKEGGRARMASWFYSKPTESLTIAAMWLDFIA